MVAFTADAVRSLVLVALGLGGVGAYACSSATPREHGLAQTRQALPLPPTPGGVDAPVFGPAALTAAPRVAYDGQDFLVTWADERGSLRDVAAARVGADGTVLDPENITLPASDSSRDKPAVAFDGTRYLVVWQEGTTLSQIHGVLVERDGSIAGQPFAIPNSSSWECHDAAAVFDGQNFVVVWMVDSTPESLAGVRVSPAGTVLDTTPKRLVQATGSTSPAFGAPVLVADASGAALAWVQEGQTYVGRLAADLATVSPTSAALGPGSVYESLALASSGSALWVAWYDTSTGDQAGLRLQRLNGSTFAPLADSLLVAPESDVYAHDPAFANLGGEMALISSITESSYQYRLLITRFSTDGSVTGDPQESLIAAPASGRHAAFAAGNPDGLLVWNDLRNGGTGVYGACIAATGASEDGTGSAIALALNKETEPAVAASGDGFLLGWYDTRGGGAQIYGTTLDAQAAVEHATATAIAPGSGLRSELVLASDSEGYLAVWRNNTGEAVGQLLGADGAPVGDPFTILSGVVSARVAFGGDAYLVVANASSSSNWNVVAARVSRAGSVLDATPVLVADDGFRPRVVSDGTDFLVYWREGDPIVGVRLAASDGQLIDPAPRTLTPAGASVADYPEATFGGGRYFVVWQNSSPWNVSAVRLDPNLDLVDSAPLVIAEEVANSSADGILPERPNPAFDGTHYAVVYTNAVVKSGQITYETWLGGVQTDGSIETPIKITDNDDSDSILDPRPIAATPGGRTVVGYTLYDAPLGYDIDRVRYKSYSAANSTLGGSCQSTADCAEGYCVDGVCCESACAGGALDCQACSLVSGSSENGACEPLPDNAACGTRGTCDSGSCIEPPPPETGGTSGTGGSVGAGGSGGGTSSGGRTSSGGSTTSAGVTSAGAGSEPTGGVSSNEAGADNAAGSEARAGGTASGATGGRRNATGGASATGESGASSFDGGSPNAAAGVGTSGGSHSSAKESGGCGCRLAEEHETSLFGWTPLVLLLGVVRRRSEAARRVSRKCVMVLRPTLAGAFAVALLLAPGARAQSVATLVKDIAPGFTSSIPNSPPVVLGEKYFFISNDNVHGRELWKSDGTEAGTVMVKDIRPGSSDGVPGVSLVVMGDHVYFAGYGVEQGNELWKSDGTEAGTVMVADLETTSSDPNDLVPVGDKLYFIAGPVAERALYVTDGTEAGTLKLVDVGIGRECTGVGSTAYCAIQDDEHPMELIYKSDGTVEGTVPVAPGIQEEAPFHLNALGDKLLFYAYDSEHGTELWRTDGTEAGTVMVKDCAPGTRSGVGSQLDGNDVVFDGGFLFSADGGEGRFMWITDGTEAGTIPVGQPPGVSGALDFRSLTSRGPDVFFKGNDGSSGLELWKTDGTAAGTAIVKDINPGPDSAVDGEPNDLNIAGNQVFFVADDGTTGYQVWRSDGTAENTVRLTHFAPSYERYIVPKHLRPVGSKLLFWADDDAPGAKLWSIDRDAPPIDDTATGGTGGASSTTGGTDASGGTIGSPGGATQGGSSNDTGTGGESSGGESSGGTGNSPASTGGTGNGGGGTRGSTSGDTSQAGSTSSVSGATSDDDDDSSKDSSGCGCRTPASDSRTSLPSALLIGLALLALATARSKIPAVGPNSAGGDVSRCQVKSAADEVALQEVTRLGT